jgi:hypothetical protein
MAVWPDQGDYERVDRWPNPKAKNNAFEVFEKLAGFDADDFGAECDEGDEGGVPYVRFTLEAQEVFDNWRDKFEPKYRSGQYPAPVEAHFLKYRSLFATLALIFEAIDFVSGESEGRAVSQTSALRAMAWCEYLESHALRLYHPAILSPVYAAASLLDRIFDGDVKHNTPVRELYRKGWQDLSTHEAVLKAIGTLKEYGWLRLAEVKPPGGGRPSQRLYLHPELRGEE